MKEEGKYLLTDGFNGVPMNQYGDYFKEIYSNYQNGTMSLGFIISWLVKMRWYFNCLFIGNPWLVMAGIMVVYNLVLNIYFGRGWAYGNFWLMGNTCYLVV